MSYIDTYNRAQTDPVSFWREQAQRVSWYEEPSEVLSPQADGTARWFGDGEMNSCYLAVDRHVDAGRGDATALVYDSPVTGTRKTLTFNELQDEVARFAGVLQGLGVGTGDRVIIYLPMVAEAAIAMLACARIGAVHSVVFGGFAPGELATRIDDATPDVLLTATCGIEFDRVIPYLPLVDEAMAMAAHPIRHRIVLQREQQPEKLASGDIDWRAATAAAEPVSCVPVKGSDPLYILYTSGTTGKPKGVVRDNGGHAVALLYSMEAVYGVTAGDVFWAASDVGWVVGHSYIVYAPLFAGCTTILFEGKPVRTPDAGTFWRIIAENQVKVFFTAPTAFRAIRKEDPDSEALARYDLSCLERVYVAGERTDPATFHWLQDTLKVPIIDHWWQTESGWPIAGNPYGIEPLTQKAGSSCVPIPGFDVRIVDETGSECPQGDEGDVVIKLPLPPGCLPTVWGDHQRFVEAYLSTHAGYYHTGDGGYFDEDGHLFIMGRTDDVINVAGHRLSTGEMEEIVASHSAVAECAVIGVEDADKGQIPVGLVITKDGVNIDAETLSSDLVLAVRTGIGAFANFRQVVTVARLPKTRSGKILRQVMRKIADGKPFEPPATIDDPVILDEIKAVFVASGIGLIAAEPN